MANDDAELENTTSLYLDSSSSSRFVQERPNPRDEEARVVPTALQGTVVVEALPSRRRINRTSRAERLAAEQATWVREKFGLASNETLVASFSAALVKHILLQGRMHITTSALCFYAKLFGRVTKEAFPFSTIRRVKKRRGGFVANAIKIYFADSTQPVVIGSLNHRERAFTIIQDRLREMNPHAHEPQDENDTASNISGGPESEDMSAEDDTLAHGGSSSGHCGVRDEIPDGAQMGSCENHTSRFALHESQGTDYFGSDSASVSSRKSSDAERFSAHGEDVHYLRDPKCVWQTVDDIVDRLAANASDKRTERARGVLNAPVIEVFNILFISDWLKCYHNSSRNSDATFSQWYRASDGYMTRNVSFTRPLGYKIGPKETRVNEKQRYSFTDKGGVVVEFEGRNLDAPYGDYFVVESFFELQPVVNSSKTMFIASMAVHFSKTTILRGKIEAGALAETKTAFEKILQLASKRIDRRSASSMQHGGTGSCVKASGKERPLLDVPPRPLNKQHFLERVEKTAAIPAASLGRQDCLMISANEVGAKTSSSSKAHMVDTENIQTGGVGRLWSVRCLHIVALSALLIVAFLLLRVVVLLIRMQNDVNALEMLMSELRRRNADRCGAGPFNTWAK